MSRYVFKVIRLLLGVLLLAQGAVAWASQSPSYQLQGGIGWTQRTGLQSEHFRIDHNAPSAAQQAGSSSSNDESEEQVEALTGGHRGDSTKKEVSTQHEAAPAGSLIPPVHEPAASSLAAPIAPVPSAVDSEAVSSEGTNLEEDVSLPEDSVIAFPPDARDGGSQTERRLESIDRPSLSESEGFAVARGVMTSNGLLASMTLGEVGLLGRFAWMYQYEAAFGSIPAYGFGGAVLPMFLRRKRKIRA